MRNPYEAQPPEAASRFIICAAPAATAKTAKARANIPPLAQEKIKAATPGELFWFITQGDVNNGMPSWATLPQRQRWLIVNYAKNPGTAAVRASKQQTSGTREIGTLERPAAARAVYRLPL